MRISVVEGTEAGLPFDVEVENREPLGRVATWLHAHLYYGLAAGVLVWLHGGGSFESPMGATLNITSLAVRDLWKDSAVNADADTPVSRTFRKKKVETRKKTSRPIPGQA